MLCGGAAQHRRVATFVGVLITPCMFWDAREPKTKGTRSQVPEVCLDRLAIRKRVSPGCVSYQQCAFGKSGRAGSGVLPNGPVQQQRHPDAWAEPLANVVIEYKTRGKPRRVVAPGS